MTPPTPATDPVSRLLQPAFAADPARPRLTYRDLTTSERVELSGATLETWLSKTAHLLTDELAVSEGDHVLLLTPRHWVTAVWWLAADRAGARPLLRPGGEPVRVVLAGPDTLEQALRLDADEVVAASLLPFGVPFAGPLPPLVRDYAVDVRSQPDRYQGVIGGDPAVASRAQQQARAWGLGPADRVLADGPLTDTADVVASLLAPLVADAAVVWTGNELDLMDVERMADEQPTAVIASGARSAAAPGLRLLAPTAL